MKPDCHPFSLNTVREVVEGSSFAVPGGILKMTIRIGAATFPDNTENFWQCAKYVDVALYKAKEGGRNQVLWFSKKG